MPTGGSFHKGDRVLSPAMRTGTVTKVSKDGLRVTVQYDELFRPPKTFHPNTLRLLMRAG